MQTVNLKVEESFLPHFWALMESLARDNKVELIDKNFPKELIVSSKEEVRRRVLEAENRIKNGDYVTEEEYENEMNKFFEEKLGIKRL